MSSRKSSVYRSGSWLGLALVSITSLAVATAACADDPVPPGQNGLPTPTTSSTRDTSGYSRVVGRLPDNFPVNFPVYEGSQIFRGDTYPGRFIIELRTADKPSDVAGFYKDKLGSSPFQTTKLIEDADQQTTVMEFAATGELTYTGTVGVHFLPEGVTRALIGVTLEP